MLPKIASKLDQTSLLHHYEISILIESSQHLEAINRSEDKGGRKGGTPLSLLF